MSALPIGGKLETLHCFVETLNLFSPLLFYNEEYLQKLALSMFRLNGALLYWPVNTLKVKLNLDEQDRHLLEGPNSKGTPTYKWSVLAPTIIRKRGPDDFVHPDQSSPI